ncbi:MAG: TolC family protein [Schleiferiaceae bacterium]|nr:TolC family protein [Schleiferiaceae bacterium]MDP4627015.1 TolC family protein [Schleiferiaceae bacterium]MDP4728266.1 TolC family protein [Schleiferiaceae bacterium]MDP4749064.1 TolC family protein [Schleiferiaceae bacterium]MDP4859955.1 TolC family protein [Schleiferiaceae bacterium]
MKRTFRTLAVLALTAGMLSAQEMRVSLANAQAYAAKHNASAQVNDLERQVSKANIWQNIAIGLPQVQVAGSYTNNIELPAQFIDFGNGELTKLTFGTKFASAGNLSASQLVFDGSYFVALLATKVVSETAELGYQKSLLEVREQVAQAYHLAVVTERNVQAVSANLELTRKLLVETKALQAEGFLESTDVDQLSLVVNNLENSLAFLNNQKEVSLALLKLQMGVPQATSVVLTDALEQLVLFTESGSALLAQGFEAKNHIDYRTLAVNREGAKLNMQNEWMSFLPRLSLSYGANVNYVSQSANVWDPSGTQAANFAFSSWGLNASVPLFTSGRRVARVKMAQLKLQELDLLLANTESMLSMQYKLARAEYSFALNNYLSQKRNETLAKSIRDRVYAKFKEGVASSQEYTQSENQYQQSVSALLNAANNVLNKRVSLEKLLTTFN